MAPFLSQAQRKWMYANKPAMAKKWAAETPKGTKLPVRKKKRLPTRKELIKEHKELVPILKSGSKTERSREAREQSKELQGLKKKRAKISVNNKLKGAMGSINLDKNGKVDGKKLKIEINVKAHKKRGKLDKAELASTIKHELTHAKHPKMTEKEVYKRAAKTKIPEGEQNKLIAKLRTKARNYKIGAYKRKYKLGRGDRKPGELFNSSTSQKAPKGITRKTRIAIMGM